MLLEVKNLSKTYYSGKIPFQALRAVSVSIAKQEFTAIAGPSGSGKTTLLNCLGTIDRAESGQILLEGMDLMGQTKNELAALRKENFGFIFQTYNLIPVLTVFENVEMPLKILRRFSAAESKKRVLAILAKVGLQGLENRRPLELSGGQQQRVSIARALVKNPKIIFADEPTANLDSANGEAIVDLMRELNEQEEATFIFSTHDPLIMKHAKRIINIRDGMIVS
ncbi:ABC transporter ATP-binding protein [candidate division FCPU426 bacterium]|nr:ABC transporter ATP-binding protein [candidate division FCPU426 bacterium]